MKTLTYKKDKQFYQELDKLIEQKLKVSILVEEGSLSALKNDVKMMRRFKSCENWNEVKHELKSPHSLLTSEIGAAVGITPGQLTGIIIILILAITGLVVVAIYKDYKVEIKAAREEKTSLGTRVETKSKPILILRLEPA